MVMAEAPPPPSSTIDTNPRVSPTTVQRAVNALLKWRNSKSEIQKSKLLEDEEFVYLILTLKKIPPKERINAYKVPLPHSLHTGDSSELCLFIDDRSKSGLTKDEAMKKIKSEGIPVSKVIKLSKLKSDYRPFEAKRKLCDSYDMFFADRRVIPLLPKLLGKHFFKKRKIPVPVDLRHKNWKEQIEKTCNSALLFFRTGTCSVVRIAKASMTAEEIAENAMAAINGIVEIVPRKWGNVRSFHLKLLESVALPVYQALPDMKLKIEGIKEEEEKEKEEERDKSVGKDEKAGKKMKKKGRIHEVRYMDVNDGEEDSEAEDVLDGDDGEDVVDGGEDCENEELGSGELVGKKRKKGDVTEEKPSKKPVKEKDNDGVKRKRDGLSGKAKKENGIEKKSDKDDLTSPVKAFKNGEAGEKKRKKKENGIEKKSDKDDSPVKAVKSGEAGAKKGKKQSVKMSKKENGIEKKSDKDDSPVKAVKSGEAGAKKGKKQSVKMSKKENDIEKKSDKDDSPVEALKSGEAGAKKGKKESVKMLKSEETKLKGKKSKK